MSNVISFFVANGRIRMLLVRTVVKQGGPEPPG